MSQTLMNTICQINDISDLMLLADSYLLYVRKHQLNIVPVQDSLAGPVSCVKASSQVSAQYSGAYLLSFIYKIVRKLNVFSQHLPNL